MTLKYVKPERLWLKSHPEFDERWVQERIADDPSLLGLGDLILRDKERVQPRAGRLDLLLQDPESNRRCEVEIQLGQTDESHIIRTIEYWDIERKRYPQYEHTGVLVAEDITSRFLNVIGLFNGFIPLVAIQMQALRLGEQVSLVFTTVLDQMALGLEEEDEEGVEVVDRSYWETRASKETLELADGVVTWLAELHEGLTAKYNKFYIGLTKDGRANNFVVLKPKKNFLRCEVRLPRSDEIVRQLASAGIEDVDYNSKSGRYLIRVTRSDIATHEAVLKQVLEQAAGHAGL